MNLINNAQTAIEKAIRHFRCMADDARIVLDSGFGTHPGERDLLYRNRKLYAELAIAALEEQQRRRWIPVEERLPEEVDERQDILILLSSGRMVVANYVKTANKGKIFFDGYDMFHPVAWQPLPDPYCPVNKTEMPDWK